MAYEKLMTNRQLSEWLAKGNGEVSNGSGCTTHHTYLLFSGDVPVSIDLVVRRFGSSEWLHPLQEVYDEDVRRNEI